MSRTRKVLLGSLAALALVLLVAVLALQRWVSTDAFRQRVEQEAATVLGVPLTLERVGLTLWPWPGVALDGVALQTRQPLKVERIELRPAWPQLLIGRMAISTLVVKRAVLPQQGIDALLASLHKIRERDRSPPSGTALQLLPRRTVLEELSWVDASGKTIVIQADAQLDSDALPERMALDVLHGRLQGTRLELRRRDVLAWEVLLQVAGGTVQGRMEVQPPAEAGAEFVLKGQLQTREVELSRLTAPEPSEAVRLRQPLSGQLEASTTLQARAREASSLLEVLQTQSKFTVRSGMLNGIDLMKAVQTVGISRGGKTPLDTLSGQVTTRGTAIDLQNLAASSGALSATGHVSVSTTQHLRGRVNVDFGGAVGMPLLVGGTVEEPEVSLTTGAKIGAALGTLLMPGLGTGAGASMGGKLGELFGK